MIPLCFLIGHPLDPVYSSLIAGCSGCLVRGLRGLEYADEDHRTCSMENSL